MQDLDRFRTRCWIKSQKKMVYGSVVLCDNGPMFCVNHERNEWVEVSDDTIIMACTGLEAASGNLVWEGDYIGALNRYGVPLHGFIEFVRGSFHIQNDGLYRLGEYGNFTVHGNIYENPIGDVIRSEDQREK